MKLRNYQQTAVTNFKNNGRVGIFNMATGTGKTYTSIAAAQDYYQEYQRQFLVIIVPFVHLVSQWESSLKAAGINVDCHIFGNSREWIHSLHDLVWFYNRNFRSRVVVIGTYQSIVSNKFENCIRNLDFQQSFLLGDECHYLGANDKQRNFLYNFPNRLGLSATPTRWWDITGTDFVRKIFGEDVYEYSLETAIKNHFLTQYEYDPIIAPFTEEEMEEFEYLTTKVKSMMHRKQKDSKIRDSLQLLLLKRARLIKQAAVKQSLLEQVLLRQKDHHYTLIYCSDKQEIHQIMQLLHRHQITCHNFDSDLSKIKRQQVLRKFSKGEIEVLVAVKCLDEGVDIPATREAFFLASTTNPREFVQRRGRILRLSPGKNKAILHDFVVFPPKDYLGKDTETLIKHELPRVFDLNEFALNKFTARKKLIPILRKLKLERYLDKSPQEIYLEAQEEMKKYGITTRY
ncbi:hypothetical protein DS830_07835 [Bombilactobacillus bombi]|uniref:DEAD/DEAH box helicase family protein n=1 Tax=Bombilactobacillus bombi TaxID=1303590 RepID=UPI000E57A19C|nr:DEAD/DEAH box helicase family protein [Bombilactobacillus bombi]AXX65399.1 hypothetical protein DS830_07835 [Bombilactobacillus bombi]